MYLTKEAFGEYIAQLAVCKNRSFLHILRHSTAPRTRLFNAEHVYCLSKISLHYPLISFCVPHCYLVGSPSAAAAAEIAFS